uniref:uncharacterized protein si:dkey-261h17.1 n=1 Tax=Scatophagus argus TaxID=75038 RepID=UPI001ED7EF05|nr:uncharacterized protein si:dkey-261h17.1 [Scatophagus argus]
MAASMWRMNGLWRRMAGLLLLCALLLSNDVRCQDEGATTDALAADPADGPGSTRVPDVSAAPNVDANPTAVGGESAASATPGDDSVLATIMTTAVNPDNQDEATSNTAGTTAAPVVARGVDLTPVFTADTHVVQLVVPEVKCVGANDISKSNAVKVEVATADCEATRAIIQENAAGWCETEKCGLRIFQNGKTALVASDDAKLSTLAETLQGEQLKDKLGVAKTETPSSSGSAVFVGVLVSGLIAALGITVAYFKCQRKSDTKGVRLAEEAYPVDQENQGNTLVSVAPLNPPPETQEKPSVNGESPEAAKTQPPPPTNGHSTTKTADTEM